MDNIFNGGVFEVLNNTNIYVGSILLVGEMAVS